MSKLFNFDIEIPAEEINFFLDNVKTKKFKKGEFFHPADKVCTTLGLVKSGLLKSFVIDDKTNEKIIEFYHENSFVSAFTSFITQEKTDWNIQTIEDSEILIMSKDFLEIL